MPSISFPSLENAEAVEVEFIRLDGSTRVLKMLVDTGFTGQSNFVLGLGASDLIQASLPPAETVGALRGPQVRGWVTCRVSALAFQTTAVAIITDVGVLSLPTGVEGMIGLTFLRRFVRWGSEQTPQGWRFFLTTG